MTVYCRFPLTVLYALDGNADQPGQGLTSDRLEGRPVVGQPGHLMAFLLVLGGDHFSDQLVALTAGESFDDNNKSYKSNLIH